MHLEESLIDNKFDSVSLLQSVGLQVEEIGAVVKGVSRSGLGSQPTRTKRHRKNKKGKWSGGRHQGRCMECSSKKI